MFMVWYGLDTQTQMSSYRRALKMFDTVSPLASTNFAELQNDGGMKTSGSSIPLTRS